MDYWSRLGWLRAGVESRVWMGRGSERKFSTLLAVTSPMKEKKTLLLLTVSRSYQTAEACSSRLTEMQHSLTSMIDELNASSATLSNTTNPNSATSTNNGTGASDPLADIVRVLNAHLAQLQAIDEGAGALQSRVGEARRAAGVMGGRLGGEGMMGGLDSGVEGFGRSYLGRR